MNINLPATETLLGSLVGWMVTFGSLVAMPSAWAQATNKGQHDSAMGGPIRVATYNVSMYRERAGELHRELISGKSAQGVQIARVIQSVRPDVLLLCEFDYEHDAASLNAFADLYLNHDQNGSDTAISYPHRISLPSNTGMFSNLDLNRDGVAELPSDGWGFGRYEGQYAMAVLSRFPIDRDACRTFQSFRWARFPDALRPSDPITGVPFHPDSVWSQMRLSSKNHADIPIDVGMSGTTRRLHFLVSHPTPPVFDGPEDLNGRRNHDEIRFWHLYVTTAATALVDDEGTAGGLDPNASFVIAGDLNSDPHKGDSRREAIRDLLLHPRTIDAKPSSADHQEATASFGEDSVRVDYVVPSADWSVEDSGVVWPSAGQPIAKDVEASDHRLVWVDLK